MDRTTRVVQAAQRRLQAAAILRASGRVLVIALGIATPLVIVSKLLPEQLPLPAWPWLIAGSITIVGVVWSGRATIRTLRRTRGAGPTAQFSAAIALDQSHKLKDRLASAIAFTSPDSSRSVTHDPFVALTIADAEALSPSVDPRRAQPKLLDGSWRLWPALAALAVGIGMFMPRLDLLSGAEKATTRAGRERAAEIDRHLAQAANTPVAEQRSDSSESPAKPPSADKHAEALAEIRRELSEGRLSPDDAAQKASGTLETAARELESSAEKLEAEHDQTLSQLAQTAEAAATENPAAQSELVRALRESDLARAAEAARELLNPDRTSSAERIKAAEELQSLADDLRTLEEQESRRQADAAPSPPENSTSERSAAKEPDSKDVPEPKADASPASLPKQEKNTLRKMLERASEALKQSASPPKDDRPNPDQSASPPQTEIQKSAESPKPESPSQASNPAKSAPETPPNSADSKSAAPPSTPQQDPKPSPKPNPDASNPPSAERPLQAQPQQAQPQQTEAKQADRRETDRQSSPNQQSSDASDKSPQQDAQNKPSNSGKIQDSRSNQPDQTPQNKNSDSNPDQKSDAQTTKGQAEKSAKPDSSSEGRPKNDANSQASPEQPATPGQQTPTKADTTQTQQSTRAKPEDKARGESGPQPTTPPSERPESSKNSSTEKTGNTQEPASSPSQDNPSEQPRPEGQASPPSSSRSSNDTPTSAKPNPQGSSPKQATEKPSEATTQPSSNPPDPSATPSAPRPDSSPSERSSPRSEQEPKTPPRHLPESLPEPTPEAVDQLAKELKRLSDAPKEAAQRQQDAEQLRRRAEDLVRNTSPQQRQQLERWAQELAQRHPDLAKPNSPDQNTARGSGSESGANSATRSIPDQTKRSPAVIRDDAAQSPTRTQLIDARSKPSPGERVDQPRVVAEWFGEGRRDAPAASEVAAAVKTAVRSGERAIEEQAVPSRFDGLLRRYFSRLNERAQPQSSSPAAPAGPQAEPARDAP